MDQDSAEGCRTQAMRCPPTVPGGSMDQDSAEGCRTLPRGAGGTSSQRRGVGAGFPPLWNIQPRGDLGSGFRNHRRRGLEGVHPHPSNCTTRRNELADITDEF